MSVMLSCSSSKTLSLAAAPTFVCWSETFQHTLKYTLSLISCSSIDFPELPSGSSIINCLIILLEFIMFIFVLLCVAVYPMF